MVKRAVPSRDEIMSVLDEVKDPEVPILSVVELGIVRDATADETGVEVTITPTYSGCPAMREIEDEIRAALTSRGYGEVRVRTTYSPPWTTDWIAEPARRKLAEYGIAPPGRAGDVELIPLRTRRAAIACPYCASTNTEQRSEFGSTACKSIWYCRECRQPFEEFKAI
jgi:ring-1,2-phenylacetyl-CoA epoxidase subunit PaaD